MSYNIYNLHTVLYLFRQRRILKDGVNYIAIRDVAKAFDVNVGAKGSIPVSTSK